MNRFEGLFRAVGHEPDPEWQKLYEEGQITNIDIDYNDIPENSRGPSNFTIGNKDTRISVNISGVTPELAEIIIEAVKSGQAKTREEVFELLKQ